MPGGGSGVSHPSVLLVLGTTWSRPPLQTPTSILLFLSSGSSGPELIVWGPTSYKACAGQSHSSSFPVCTPREALSGPGPAREPEGTGCKSPACAWRGCPGPVSSLSLPLRQAGVGLTVSVGSLGRGPMGSAGITALERVNVPTRWHFSLSLRVTGSQDRGRPYFPRGQVSCPSGILHPRTCL